ncbi:MAG: DUF4919 domain-containing protein [Muribaculaceae bacterium]|nr:DUF4919 domain-containing protein [Muribaculaceae bacterium]
MKIINTRRYILGMAVGLPLIGLLSITSEAQSRPRANQSQTKRYVVKKPDLSEIQRATLDPNSDYYYPKLVAKYEKKDTTMTPNEFRYYYLGYMFQEDFDPYRTSPYTDKTDRLRSKTKHTKSEMDTIENYATLALADNPFDLRQMSFLVHVLKEQKKDMRAKLWEYRLENLLGAIMSTGTGKDIDNPWYVIYPMHEYDVAQLLGYEAVDVQYPRDGFDYLIVEPDPTDKRARDKSAKGFYYNVVIPQEQYELKHGDANSDENYQDDDINTDYDLAE